MSIGCSTCGKILVQKGEKGDTGATGNAGTNGTNASALMPTTLANQVSLTLVGSDTGELILLDRATGVDIALPEAPADGTKFTFQTKTDPSGGVYAINAQGTDIFAGFVYAKVSGSADTLFSATLGTENQIALNGTTSGGLIGTDITVIYRADGAAWYTSGVNRSSGVVITPFA